MIYKQPGPKSRNFQGHHRHVVVVKPPFGRQM